MAPVTPATPTIGQEIAAVEKKIGVWLDPAHIVLIILLGLSLLGIVYLHESKSADAWKVKAEAATQVAALAQKAKADSDVQNAAQQAKDAAIEAEMQALNTQLQAANAVLIKANTQLSSQLSQQLKVDKTLPPAGQAQRWEQLVPQAQVAATPTGFTIDAVGGLNTLLALERENIEAQQIKNFEDEVANDEKTIANDLVSLNAEKAAHASDVANDKVTLKSAQDDLKKTKDDFTEYKHHARKMYVVIGVVAFFTGHIVKPF